MRWLGLGALIAIGLSACGGGAETARLTPQQWDDIVVIVETRPAPPRAGMNEFLVIATAPGGKPVWDMVVSLRAGADDGWRQAIQDGESGVYRKALPLSPGDQTLHVGLRRAGADAVLEFPLQVQ